MRISSWVTWWGLFCFGGGTAKLAGDATVARRGQVRLQRAGGPAAGRSGWEGHGRARRPDDTNRRPPAWSRVDRDAGVASSAALR
jgi:hypothetical protein